MSQIISRLVDALVQAHAWMGEHVNVQYDNTHINYHPFRMYVSFYITVYSGGNLIQIIPIKVKVTKDWKSLKLVDPNYDARKDGNDE